MFLLGFCHKQSPETRIKTRYTMKSICSGQPFLGHLVEFVTLTGQVIDRSVSNMPGLLFRFIVSHQCSPPVLSPQLCLLVFKAVFSNKSAKVTISKEGPEIWPSAGTVSHRS